MYLAHFGLKEKPFQISPDPRFLWLGETHKEALARLKFGIHDNRGFLLLVGDVGTGKTTLINGLLESLDKNTLVATISDPGLEKLDFFNFLVNAFNINKQFTSKGDFLVYFIHFLHKAHAADKRVLIIIDEAQRLTHEMLEEIRQLSNIETQSAKLLNIFLIGQNELNETLLESRNRALLQRITTRYSIGPLPAKEVDDYIKFRLNVAGCDTPLFSAGAVRQVISFSNCYPRLINVICDHALLTAFVRGKKKIDARMVKECADDLSIKVETPKDDDRGKRRMSLFGVSTPFWRRPLVGISLILLLAMLMTGLAGLFFFDKGWRPQPASAPVGQTTIAGQTEAPVEPAREAVPTPAAQPESSDEATDTESVVPGAGPTEATPTQAAPAAGRDSALSAADIEAHLDRTFTIRFEMDSNDFSDDAFQLMNRLAKVAKQTPDLRVSISGYTDSLGNYDYNRRLSEFRANVVKSYLIGQGVSPSQVRTFGRGPDNPIESNETREGRAANRRVEIVLHRGSVD